MNLAQKDIANTSDSRIGHILMSVEDKMINKVKFPFGIRNIILAQKK